jgi:copper chaperone NosL
MRVLACSVLLALLACSETTGPAELAFNSESCAYCRMVIADKRFPSQIVGAREDPKFFDDLDCLARHVREHPLAEGARVFVTDYKNSTWIAAGKADFFRCANMASPMNSGLIASAKGGSPTFCTEVSAAELFGKELP